jgi:hypothetical protein
MEDAVKIWRAKVLNAARRATRLLAEDAARYVNGAIRGAFVADQAFADEMPDADLARLKTATAECAEAARGFVGDALTEEVWLSAAPPEDAAAPLTVHEPVAQLLSAVTGQLTALMAGHQIPGAPPAWSLPVRFIEGESLPTLGRAFWKALAQLRSAEEEAARQAHGSDAGQRARRWDDA